MVDVDGRELAVWIVFNVGACEMKNRLASMAMGCMVMISASAYAAGEASESQMSASADAQTAMSHGEVRKVDAAAGKLTIKHGPLENLGMDAMTMVFKVKDPAILAQVKPGDTIDFIADEVAGVLTVVKLEKR
ncbi:Cu/Ag efflux protein CusF [Paraburkholderia sp. BL27I4N3]|nr:Cu/Ag efflux protein CusF [Paraburkholderia sp. BL27I4N3]RKR37973.1 Cu/Ag efflux protein CusF [Paraburkholderia sp. BL17N1]